MVRYDRYLLDNVIDTACADTGSTYCSELGRCCLYQWRIAIRDPEHAGPRCQNGNLKIDERCNAVGVKIAHFFERVDRFLR